MSKQDAGEAARVALEPDPGLREAEVMYGQRALIGSRVRHFCERYTGGATATVRGFRVDRSDQHPRGWIKVIVAPDAPQNTLGRHWIASGWDWDRTELVGDR